MTWHFANVKASFSLLKNYTILTKKKKLHMLCSNQLVSFWVFLNSNPLEHKILKLKIFFQSEYTINF